VLRLLCYALNNVVTHHAEGEGGIEQQKDRNGDVGETGDGVE
jgi:hypothetical protein